MFLVASAAFKVGAMQRLRCTDSAEEVGERLNEKTFEAEERLHAHLGAIEVNEPLVLVGQVVGLLSAAECLLALYPSNQVAAFCVQLAAIDRVRAICWGGALADLRGAS